jgi:hypothetical protein
MMSWLVTHHACADTLLCVEEVAGGLKFVDGRWKGVPFNTGMNQLVVTSSDNRSYEVKRVGENHPTHRCERSRLPDGSLVDQIVCGGLGYGMLINFEKLRYVEIYSLGYIEDDQSGDNTPSVTGGKCTTIAP